MSFLAPAPRKPFALKTILGSPKMSYLENLYTMVLPVPELQANRQTDRLTKKVLLDQTTPHAFSVVYHRPLSVSLSVTPPVSTAREQGLCEPRTRVHRLCRRKAQSFCQHSADFVVRIRFNIFFSDSIRCRCVMNANA